MPITSRAFVRSQLIFVAVGLLALAAIVSVAFWLGERSGQIATEILAARDFKTASVTLGAAVRQAESSQRGYLYTGNEVYLAPYDTAKAAALREVEALPARLTTYPDRMPAADRLALVLTDKFIEMDQTIAYVRARNMQAALDLTLTNRGKQLMDEANVFITGLSLAADDRLAQLAAEQSDNALWQRLVSVIGALVAIAAAAGGLITILRYAGEVAEARNSLSNANAQLESKVAARTADLARSNEEMRAAKERAEMLVHEVNHRVANSLSIVSSLVGLQANAGDAATKAALAETQSRIQAVALVHQRLYSSDSVAEVELDQYLRSLLDQFQSTVSGARRISLTYELEPISLRTDASINLGVIAAEWVMNATKYAYPDGSGTVHIGLSRQGEGRAVLVVEDDGVGHPGGKAKGTGLGTRIVKAMATSLHGKVEYVDRQPGLSARLAFPLVAA